MFDIFFDPFIYHGFMRRALVACCALSLSSTPIGMLLLLRRMTLVGDALSHAILPGVAIGYFLFGGSIIAIGFGGLVSGFLVGIFSGWISSRSVLQEESSFAGVYLIFLSSGIILISLCKFDLHLLDLLFGSVFSIDVYQIRFIGFVTSLSLLGTSIFYRALIIETCDAKFLQGNSMYCLRGIQIFFILLVVLNLVVGCQVVGTLMSVGLITLPSLFARCWTINFFIMLCISICVAILSSLVGLLGAFYTSLPPGPIIIFCNGIAFVFSMFFGRYRGIIVS